MKSILGFTILLITTSSLAQTNVWIQKDTVNGDPRSVASVFVAGGEGFTAGGLDYNGFRRRMFSYTDTQDDWDSEPSIGGVNGSGLSRGSASAFGIGNFGYVCLGQGETNPFFKDLWQYDTQTKVWTQMADFIGSPRRQAVAFAIGDTAYVGTGIAESGLCKDMFKYVPETNTWTQIADFGGTARKEAVGFAMGDQGYIGTGDDGVMKKDFWQYEPTTDTWTQKPDFPGTARKGAVGWGQFPQAFICTGEDVNFDYKNDLWEYNYYGNVWVQRADFAGPARSNAFAFVLNGVAYVGTGYNGGFLNDLYAYNRILGVSEQDKQMEVTVYPNPVSSQFSVSLDNPQTTLEVFDLNGKNVTGMLTISKSNDGFKVSRNFMPAGTYTLRLVQKNSSTVLYNERIIFI